MFESFFHDVLKAPKVCLISAVNSIRGLIAPDRDHGGVTPDFERIQNQYNELRGKVVLWDCEGKWFYILRPWEKAWPGPLGSGHQALRTGSLLWADPESKAVSGLSAFIDDSGIFYRGIESFEPMRFNEDPLQPATPMSIAFSIASLLRNKVPIPECLVVKYLRGLNRFIDDSFRVSDCSVEKRPFSMGFDAIFALSCLSAGHAISGNEKYLEEMRKVFSTHGCLMRSPITYFSNRNYHVDHISMFGLWTILQTCKEKEILEAARAGMKSVFGLSHSALNPYFCAMMSECGLLEDRDRKNCLAVNWAADCVRACQNADLAEHSDPIVWDQVRDPEFIFDQLKSVVPTTLKNEWVFLSGLVLARSLLVLGGKVHPQ